MKFIKENWKGILSVSYTHLNCPGLHTAEEPWNPSEAEKLFSLSKEYGVPIDAAEFANEPNMMEETGFPKGYTPAHYRRDQDLFFKWLRENYPECLCVGPSTTGGDNIKFGKGDSEDAGVGGIEQLAAETCNCSDLLDGTTEPLDVFSYHYYNGVSERLASVMPNAHWSAEEANSEAYLETALNFAHTYVPLRDKYVPGGEMWVTESGDAGGGGDTWASTYLDVFRTLNAVSYTHLFSDRAVDDTRDENIFPDRQSVEQHKILKDKTEFFIADLGKLVVVQVGERLSAEFDISFLKWNVAGNTI